MNLMIYQFVRFTIQVEVEPSYSFLKVHSLYCLDSRVLSWAAWYSINRLIAFIHIFTGVCFLPPSPCRTSLLFFHTLQAIINLVGINTGIHHNFLKDVYKLSLPFNHMTQLAIAPYLFAFTQYMHNSFGPRATCGIVDDFTLKKVHLRWNNILTHSP